MSNNLYIMMQYQQMIVSNGNRFVQNSLCTNHGQLTSFRYTDERTNRNVTRVSQRYEQVLYLNKSPILISYRNGKIHCYNLKFQGIISKNLVSYGISFDVRNIQNRLYDESAPAHNLGRCAVRVAKFGLVRCRA